MNLIKTLTTPAGHELVNVPAQLSVLLELGFSAEQAQILLQPPLAEVKAAKLAAIRQHHEALFNPRKTTFADAKHRSGSHCKAREWSNYPRTLLAVSRRLQGVVIECRPAQDVIRVQDAPDTLFFVDPPYVPCARSKSGYRHEMSQAEHVALLEQLRQVKGMVVLAGYPLRPHAPRLAEIGAAAPCAGQPAPANRGAVAVAAYRGKKGEKTGGKRLMCSQNRALLVLSSTTPVTAHRGSENPMPKTFLIDQFDSFDALVHHINQRPDWRRDMLAGQYAYEMAGADYHDDDELADECLRNSNGDFMFTAHLNELARHGCRFTKPVALEHAKGCANLPFDLSDWDTEPSHAAKPPEGGFFTSGLTMCATL